jgi:hypothetical protein
MSQTSNGDPVITASDGSTWMAFPSRLIVWSNTKQSTPLWPGTNVSCVTRAEHFY